MNTELQKLQRSFILGDEWLYFKIYTGYKTSETLIREAISPLINQLFNEQIIDKWFFIRFTDPKYHIRIRFHLNDNKRVSEVILNFNNAIKQYLEEGLIWKVQTDTYQREIERYGINTMIQSEDIFYIDSMTTLEIINQTYGNESENIRWLLSIKMIDDLLNNFEYNLQQKNDLLKIMQENFSKEFGITKDYRKQIGIKYRNYKTEIEKIIKNETYREYENIFLNKSKYLKPIIRNILNIKDNNLLNIDFSNLITSYIHMMLNRLFRTNQRKYELVIYDFLYRYYYSQITRQLGKNLKSQNALQNAV